MAYFSDGVLAIIITICCTRRAGCKRGDPVGEPAPVVLALTAAVLHGLGGAESSGCGSGAALFMASCC